MRHVRFVGVVQLFTIFLILFSYGAEQKTPESILNVKPIEWAPVDDSDWDIFMDAPAYHFKLAKQYFQKGESSKAASELEMGNAFLNYEKDRIELIVNQIRDLAKKVSMGKEDNINEFDAVTSNALKIIGKKYAMVPISVKASPIFENAYKYHLANAKSKLKENNRAEAASEIKRAAAFLKMKIAQTGKTAQTDIDAMGKDLKKLAEDVENGVVKDAKDIDSAFQKALSGFSKEKQIVP